MAYGVKATRKVLETIAAYVHAQDLTDPVVKIEELFAPATLDL
jgi:4,5-dihydroxyphthalate decarboxylase